MANSKSDNPPVEKRYCYNCHYPLPGYGQYCPNCSQKYTKGKIGVGHLLLEFFESIFNIDSKIFRTLGHLFIPGKLTANYFAGRQKRYIPPVRIFFVLAIVHFAGISFIFNNSDLVDDGLDNISESNRRQSYRAELLQEIDSVSLEIEKQFPDPQVKVALDSLLVGYGNQRGDSTILFVASDSILSLKTMKISRPDLVHLSQEDLFKKYNINGFWQKLWAKQSLKIIDQGGNFIYYIIGQMIWMVVLMMPALALILKILYIRRGFYFVEHLVFSFHYHAFAFLIMTTTYSLEGFGFPPFNWPAGTGTYVLIGFGILFIYLYLAMRRFYKQGRFKTFIKFSMLNFGYIFIFTLFLIFTLLISALIF